MKKIDFKIALTDNTTEVRTAYLLDKLIHGVRFVVVRNDACHHDAKWSVSQFDTGYKAGPDCFTRKDAVQALHDRVSILTERKGADFVANQLHDTVAEYPIINVLFSEAYQQG